jgi:diguanylate cyclase (GGDEF)-like protein/PAS domain S-box-containing protein
MDVRLLCVIVLLSSAVGSLLLAWFGWKRRRSVPAAWAFSGLMLAVALYTVGYALELSRDTVSEMLVGSRIEYLGISFLPMFWLLLAFRFNSSARRIPRSIVALLLVIALLTVLIFFTNGMHHLHYRTVGVDMSGPFPLLSFTRGPWYWFHILYSNIAILLGNALFLSMMFRSVKHFRVQPAVMLAGSLLPWSALIVHLAGLVPWGIDPIPFALATSGVLYAFGLFRFRLFDLAPMARSLLVENLGDAVIAFNHEGLLVDFNRAAVPLLAKPPQGAVGSPRELVLAECPGLLAAVRAGGGLVDEVAPGPGAPRLVAQVSVTPLEGSWRRDAGSLVLIHDISELKKTEEALRDSEEKFRLLFDAAPDPILLMDDFCRFIDCNAATVKMLGVPSREYLLHRQPSEFSPDCQPDGCLSSEKAASVMRSAFVEGSADVEWEFLRTDGSRLVVDVSITIISIKGERLQLVHWRDISDKKEAERELRELSLIDELTGLHNRRGFLTLATQQIKVADRLGRGITLLYSDLDNLKWINDTFGHNQGDRAIMDAADILKASFRASDIVSRMGGDEFAGFALESGTDSGKSIIARLEENLRAHNMRTDRPHRLSLSYGTSRYDVREPSTLEELLERSDRDMYRQKQKKKMDHPVSV